jgi:hypothetical protein
VGYGLTLPLHLVLAQRVGRAAADVVPDALFINACYPDAANAVLVSAGLPVLCGIGNVAILAAVMAADMKIRSTDLQMIAHHAHVAAAISGAGDSLPFLKAWHEGHSIDEESRRWVRGARLPSDQRLNLVTAAAAVGAVMSLLGMSGPLRTNLPGPLGRPGGYPVLVERGLVSLELPRGITESDALKLHDSAAAFDGVSVDAHGVARLSDRALTAMSNLPQEYRSIMEPLSADAGEQRARLLIQLRSALSDGQPDAPAR